MGMGKNQESEKPRSNKRIHRENKFNECRAPTTPMHFAKTYRFVGTQCRAHFFQLPFCRYCLNVSQDQEPYCRLITAVSIPAMILRSR